MLSFFMAGSPFLHSLSAFQLGAYQNRASRWRPAFSFHLCCASPQRVVGASCGSESSHASCELWERVESRLQIELRERVERGCSADVKTVRPTGQWPVG